MDQKERLEMILGMRPKSNFCNLFNDNYEYDKQHPDKIYICWVCNRWFTLRDTLRVHLKTNYHKRHLLKDDSEKPTHFICSCGCRCTKKHKARHERTAKHKNKLLTIKKIN